MSKCVLLLMQVLNETNDSKMLFEVCMQLRKSPDADKKYLRDKEREQLSVQALTLCLQCLRNRIKIQSIQKISSTNHYTTLSDQTNTLLDIYHTYHYMKNIPEYRVSELPKVQKILEDAYVQYTGNLNQKIQGNVFDLAKEFCRIKLRGSKTIAAENVARVPHETNAFIPLNILNGNINATKDALTTNEEQQTQKIFSYEISNQVQTSVTTKSQQTSNYKSKVLNNQMEIKPSLSETTLICDPKYLTDNLYSSSAFIEANILSSMLGSNFGVNVMDTAINYFNQVEIYQNILQQYQNNLTVSSSSMNYTNVISSHSVTHEPSIYKPKINFDRMKERPGISITPIVSPVNSLSDERIKSLNTDSEKTSIPRVTICSPKRVKVMPSQKRSVSNVNKRSITGSLSCNETYITAKTFKNNRGDQSLFPESIHVGSTSEWSTSTDKERTISLQHKLKKQIQRSHLSSKVINLVERSSVRNPSPNIITEQTETSTYPLPLRGKMVTVDETFSERLKELSTVQKSKSKIYSSQQPARILENTDKNQAFSVLSHLQQHSHLEIIPQTKHTKKYANEIIKKPRISTLPQSVSISNTQNISVSRKSNRKLVDKQSSETKMKKSCVDTSVEIITLDD
ncbi:uncharacterized protein LOC106636407 [Copidosoma floridanum]|uniref:uncharacterized protein LOC106636407 n=1 Tax=Copidosoma floridanum TaxID=29053 RepID=UPI0006C9807C|nr:uncharacterized protein LOC106636407 [Copidosoma floridanum]